MEELYTLQNLFNNKKNTSRSIMAHLSLTNCGDIFLSTLYGSLNEVLFSIMISFAHSHIYRRRCPCNGTRLDKCSLM